VRIDEAGDHRAPAEVDDPRMRAGKRADLVIAADSENFPVGDRDRLADGVLGIHSDDLAVEKDHVGLGISWRSRNQPDRPDQQADEAPARETVLH